MIPVGALIVVAFFIASLVLTTEYFRRVTIERPPYGHFNWIDLIFAFIFIIGAPFGYLALPQWGVTLIFALIFLTLLNLSLSPLMSFPALLRIFLFVGAVIAQGIIFFSSGSFMFSNILALAIFVCIGPVFVKNGLQPKEIALFSVALMVYDIIATVKFGVMMQFVEKMLSQPYFLGFVTGDILIGGGDVVLSSIFVATTIKYKGYRKGYGLIAALTVPLIFISMLFYSWGYLVPIPYLIIAAPVYLFLYYVVFK